VRETGPKIRKDVRMIRDGIMVELLTIRKTEIRDADWFIRTLVYAGQV
jgi:hypothetical protein